MTSTADVDSITGDFGGSVDRGCNNCQAPGNDFYSLTYRHYFFDDFFGSTWRQFEDRGWFAYAKIIHFDSSGRFGNGTWYGGGMGYRTKGNILPNIFNPNHRGRWFVEGSLGYGALDHPDGDPDGDNYGLLTGHDQIEITFGAGYRINNNGNITFGFGHLSNCKQLCNRSSRKSPNNGRDFWRVGYEHKFKFFNRSK